MVLQFFPNFFESFPNLGVHLSPPDLYANTTKVLVCFEKFSEKLAYIYWEIRNTLYTFLSCYVRKENCFLTFPGH